MDISTKHKFIGITLVVLGLLVVVYSFAALVYRVSFAKFLIALGVLSMTLGILTLQEKYKVQIPNTMANALKTFMAVFIISFIVIEGLIIYHGNKKENAEVDYLVVLGAGLWGEIPSLSLRQRLDESLIFIKNNPDTKIVLSGGMGPGETITEAEAMKRYLVQRGVKEDLLIKEDKSSSTKENLQFTMKLLQNIKEGENPKIQLVTNNFHMFRAKLLAKNIGFEVYGQPAPLHLLLMPAYYVREYMAVIKSLIFDFR